MKTSTLRIPLAAAWVALAMVAGPVAGPDRLRRGYGESARALATAEAPALQDKSRPWPPAVQPMLPESPPLAPEAAMQSFYMPPGYRVELVASEPLIQEPVALDWDADGRLWAVEMPGFMADLTGSNEHEPKIGRAHV